MNNKGNDETYAHSIRLSRKSLLSADGRAYNEALSRAGRTLKLAEKQTDGLIIENAILKERISSAEQGDRKVANGIDKLDVMKMGLQFSMLMTGDWPFSPI